MKKGSIVSNNFLAKIFSLILAIATWFYVFDLVNSDSFMQRKETLEEILFRYKFVMREIPVKPVFYGKIQDGYNVLFDKVKIVPNKVAVFGPEGVVDPITDLKTDRIDLNEYTRSVKLTLGLHSGNRFLQMKDKKVEVYIPIESVDKSKNGILNILQ